MGSRVRPADTPSPGLPGDSFFPGLHCWSKDMPLAQVRWSTARPRAAHFGFVLIADRLTSLVIQVDGFISGDQWRAPLPLCARTPAASLRPPMGTFGAPCHGAGPGPLVPLQVPLERHGKCPHELHGSWSGLGLPAAELRTFLSIPILWRVPLLYCRSLFYFIFLGFFLLLVVLQIPPLPHPLRPLLPAPPSLPPIFSALLPVSMILEAFEVWHKCFWV